MSTALIVYYKYDSLAKQLSWLRLTSDFLFLAFRDVVSTWSSGTGRSGRRVVKVVTGRRNAPLATLRTCSTCLGYNAIVWAAKLPAKGMARSSLFSRTFSSAAYVIPQIKAVCSQANAQWAWETCLLLYVYIIWHREEKQTKNLENVSDVKLIILAPIFK